MALWGIMRGSREHQFSISVVFELITLIILSLDSPCCWMTSYGILGNFSGVLHEILGIHGFHLCSSPLYLFWVLLECVCVCVCVCAYACILNTRSLIDSNFQQFHKKIFAYQNNLFLFLPNVYLFLFQLEGKRSM